MLTLPKNYNFKERAEQCFRSVFFSSLASSDGKSLWNSPLWLVKDENWNFYFRSRLDSRHVKNIEKNDNVAIAIYESKQIDSIAGLQISGKAVILSNPEDIEKAMKYYHTDEVGLTHLEYTDDKAVFKLVKIEPTEVFIFDQRNLGDKRVQIPIEKLK